MTVDRKNRQGTNKMSSSCRLPIGETTWESGIPSQCYECFNRALARTAFSKQTTEFDVAQIGWVNEWLAEKDISIEETNGYSHTGVNRPDLSAVRVWTVENGLETHASDEEGPLFSIENTTFECENWHS